LGSWVGDELLRERRPARCDASDSTPGRARPGTVRVEPRRQGCAPRSRSESRVGELARRTRLA